MNTVLQLSSSSTTVQCVRRSWRGSMARARLPTERPNVCPPASAARSRQRARSRVVRWPTPSDRLRNRMNARRHTRHAAAASEQTSRAAAAAAASAARERVLQPCSVECRSFAGSLRAMLFHYVGKVNVESRCYFRPSPCRAATLV